MNNKITKESKKTTEKATGNDPTNRNRNKRYVCCWILLNTTPATITLYS